MGDVRDHVERRSVLDRVIESNEYRLDALVRQGVDVTVDGPTVLQFLFERALATASAREFQLDWVLNVAGLVKQLEADARPVDLAGAESGERPARVLTTRS